MFKDDSVERGHSIKVLYLYFSTYIAHCTVVCYHGRWL